MNKNTSKNGSDNLKKLHEIVNILESKDYKVNIDFDSNNPQYKKLTEKIDTLIHQELKKLEFEQDNNNKLQCYEALFTSVIGLLEGVKQIV